MVASSLFADWTSSSKDYPATSLLEHLIKLFAADVCHFRRNTLTSYQLVDTIRTLIDKVNAIIEDVETKGMWEDFEKYTSAIDPLEEILLEFGLAEELNEDVDLLDSSSVVGFTSFIQRWEDNRKTLRERIEKLTKQEILSKLLDGSQDDCEAAYKHDDCTLLRDLVASIKAHLTSDKIKGKPTNKVKLLEEVSRGVSEVEARLKNATSLPAGWDVLAIKSMMAVYGLIRLGADKNILLATRRHLNLEQPWMIAKNLISELIGTSDKQSCDSVKTWYDKLLKEFELHVDGDLPASYRALLKIVAQFGRLHHAQALLLVTLCHELADSYLGEQERNEQHYFALQEVFDQTLSNLEKLLPPINSTTGPKGLLGLYKFDINAYEQDPCVKSFKTSAEELSSCFEALGVKQATKGLDRLETAFKQDKARVEKVQSRVKKLTNPDECEKIDTIEVTVKVQKGQSGGSGLGSFIINAPSTSRLAAIGWGIARLPELAGKVTTKEFKFEHETGSQPASVPAEKDIKSLAVDKKLTIIMTV